MTNDSNKPDANLCRGGGNISVGSLSKNKPTNEVGKSVNPGTYKNKKSIILPIKKDISNHLDWKGNVKNMNPSYHYVNQLL